MLNENIKKNKFIFKIVELKAKKLFKSLNLNIEKYKLKKK